MAARSSPRAASATPTCTTTLLTRFHTLVEARLTAAGFADAGARARMLVKAADGLKHAGGSEADYVADVRALAAATVCPPAG